MDIRTWQLEQFEQGGPGHGRCFVYGMLSERRPFDTAGTRWPPCSCAGDVTAALNVSRIQAHLPPPEMLDLSDAWRVSCAS